MPRREKRPRDDRDDDDGSSIAGRRVDSLRRVVPPLVVLTGALLAPGCLTHDNSGVPLTYGGVTARVNTRPSTAGASVGPGLDDAMLDMTDLDAQRVSDVNLPPVQVPSAGDRPTVHVLPAGNVPTKPLAIAPSAIVSTTAIRWVKNTAATTLWSGSNADAAAFTEVPEDSFLRVVGPEEGARVPVYYVGDGMLRRPGNGWIDAATVETIDAPPPGQVSAIDADAKRPLPVWVQAHRATTLWSGPDDKAVTLTDLPQWTFLKVGGLERGGRLLVNYAGDYASRQPGIGWVDAESVGPAGDPGRWVANYRASGLWSGADDNAQRFTDVPQWTSLRLVDGSAVDPGRVQVEFFGDGRTREPGIAWIDRADIGPITPPVPLPASAASQTPQMQPIEARTFTSGTEFINVVSEAARRTRKTTGVPTSVTVAQAILESDWGRSRLARQGNNLFGIKALGGASGPAGVVTLATWEHVGMGDVVVQAPFKAYYTLDQSIDDHGNFFVRNHRYAAALAQASDPRAFARGIQAAGYATDPNYANKLIALMDRYNLYRFDS